MRTAEKLAWMAKYAHTLHIDVNDHRSCYETLADHLEHDDRADPRERAECIEAGTVATVQVYPHTPISFYCAVRADLAAAIDDAFSSMRNEDLGAEANEAGALLDKSEEKP